MVTAAQAYRIIVINDLVLYPHYVFWIHGGKLFIVNKTAFSSGPAVAQRILKSEKLGRASDLPKEEETL